MNSKTHSLENRLRPCSKPRMSKFAGSQCTTQRFDVQELSQSNAAPVLPSEVKAAVMTALSGCWRSAPCPPVGRLRRPHTHAPLHARRLRRQPLRADPWRWWFAWVAIEIIARLGPDDRGEKVGRSSTKTHHWKPSSRSAPMACRQWIAVGFGHVGSPGSTRRPSATETGSANENLTEERLDGQSTASERSLFSRNRSREGNEQ